MQITRVLEQQRFDHDSLSNVPRNKRGKKNLSHRYEVTSGFSRFYRENKVIASIVLAILFLASFGLILGVAAPSLPPSRDQCTSTCLVDYYSPNSRFVPLYDFGPNFHLGPRFDPNYCALFPSNRLEEACYEADETDCFVPSGICRNPHPDDEGPFIVEGRFNCALNSTRYFKPDGTFRHGRERCFGLRSEEDLSQSENISATRRPERNDPEAAQLKASSGTMRPRIRSTTRQQKNDLRTAQPRIHSTTKPETGDLATAQPKAPFTTVQPKIGSTMNQQEASLAKLESKNHSEKRGLSKLLFFGSLLHFMARGGRE